MFNATTKINKLVLMRLKLKVNKNGLKRRSTDLTKLDRELTFIHILGISPIFEWGFFGNSLLWNLTDSLELFSDR